MVKKCVTVFRMALIALCVSVICLLLIPLVGERLTVQYSLAGLFWASLVAELVLMGISNSLRRRIEKVTPKLRAKRRHRRVGLISFAQNREALICDLLLAVSAVYLTMVSIFLRTSLWPVLTGILTTYILFHLHCILNGVLYNAIKHYHKVINKRRERT